MIKINDQFSNNRYAHGWELHHTTLSKDKNGNPKNLIKITFYPTIQKVLNEVINRSAGDCNELKEISAKIDAVVGDFKTAGVRPC